MLVYLLLSIVILTAIFLTFFKKTDSALKNAKEQEQLPLKED